MSVAEKKVIILDGLKFDWTETEIKQFCRYWNIYQSHSHNAIEIVKQIATDMDGRVDEIFLLALDQARKGNIKWR